MALNPNAPSGSAPAHPPPSSNPQLGPEPYFAYPTPTPEQLEEELPPYFEDENVPLGLLLDRFARDEHQKLENMLGEMIPRAPANARPRIIIDHAKRTRQGLLKYLAILRWKTSVDVPSTLPASSNPLAAGSSSASFPTPHSTGESNDASPGAFVGKGKGRAAPSAEEGVVVMGKATDAKRIAHFMEHQNKQHEVAVDHVKHVTKVVEGLRERNPDLLTALSLHATGTYSRLPTSLVDPYLAKPRLTNSAILKVLRRLNRQIRYRVRCLDYVPPELVLEEIKDGRMYARGDGWRAELTLLGFDEGSRWWLTGVEWGWKVKEKGVDDPGGKVIRRFKGDERQGILDVVNGEVLVPREVDQGEGVVVPVEKNAAPAGTPVGGGEGKAVDGADETKDKIVDAPLVRVCNYLQHLSLSYQLEVLFAQAVALSQGKWRGQLIPHMDREAKTLRLQYWIRERPIAIPRQEAAAVGKRPQPAVPMGAPRTPMVGGTLNITLAEKPVQRNELESLLGAITTGGLVPSERVLKLELGVKWFIGEVGVGGGLKAGDAMDSGGMLRLDPNALSLEDLLITSTRAHAAHLTRVHTTALLSNPRLTPALLNNPSLQESSDPSTRPLTLHIPLPSRYQLANLFVGVSPYSGLLEIEDEGAKGNEARGQRVKMSMAGVNEGTTKPAEAVWRLTIAVVTENIEMQMRQLGWQPTRELAIRSRDLTKAELHPVTTVFVPLPSSPVHYFICRITGIGITFELLKLIRVPSEVGLGMKLVVGDRTTMDLEKLRARRKAGGEKESRSAFEVENRDLKDMFILCNALVAQTIVEQQLKDRSIPYTQVFPPTTGPAAPKSSSPLAGMVPTICVHVRDLLRGGRDGGDAALEVAMPKVWLQIEGWWKGGKCEVVTIVMLRHQPSVASPDSPQPDIPQAVNPSVGSARPEGISFDPAESIVRFRATDISRCVPAFLEQWERLSKVIVVAGEVNRLNKTESFKDMKMLSFDLCTATLQYAKGHNASITYTPTDDSYQVTLFLDDVPSASLASSTSSSPSTKSKNPHEVLAPLLSAKLNELTDVSNDESRKKGVIGREFMGTLRSTLPLLKAVNDLESRDLGWTLVVLGVGAFRLVKDHEGKRYAIDFALLPDLEHYLIEDASKPRGVDGTVDTFNGTLTPIPIATAIDAVFNAEKSAPAPASALSAATPGVASSPEQTKEGSRLPSPKSKTAPVVKLDGGKALMVDVDRVDRVLLRLTEEAGKSVEGGMDVDA
ncbi:hypothetical protein IAT38_007379 [Cryptococcus sp. DSM 104549]